MESFNRLKTIYEEVKENIDIQKVIIFLVGNKTDQYMHEQIKKDEVQNYAKTINATCKWVSALDATGIENLFESVAKSFFIKDNGENKTNEPEDSNKKEFKLKSESKGKKKKKLKFC